MSRNVNGIGIRVKRCDCFVSWCANEYGYLTAPDVVQKVTTVQMKKLLARYKQVGKQ